MNRNRKTEFFYFPPLKRTRWLTEQQKWRVDKIHGEMDMDQEKKTSQRSIYILLRILVSFETKSFSETDRGILVSSLCHFFLHLSIPFLLFLCHTLGVMP